MPGHGNGPFAVYELAVRAWDLLVDQDAEDPRTCSPARPRVMPAFANGRASAEAVGTVAARQRVQEAGILGESNSTLIV